MYENAQFAELSQNKKCSLKKSTIVQQDQPEI